jgi:hypothetical protein
MSNDSSKPGELIRASALADSWLADTSVDFQSNDQIYEVGRALIQLGGALSSCTNATNIRKPKLNSQPSARACMSALSPGSTLVQSGLLQVSEGARPLDATIRLSEKFTRSLWDRPGHAHWHFETREQANDHLRRMAQAGRKQIERTEEDEFLDADADADAVDVRADLAEVDSKRTAVIG